MSEHDRKHLRRVLNIGAYGPDLLSLYVQSEQRNKDVANMNSRNRRKKEVCPLCVGTRGKKTPKSTTIMSWNKCPVCKTEPQVSAMVAQPERQLPPLLRTALSYTPPKETA